MRREAFSNLWIWDKVGNRLPWYYQVANNRMPAKYLIAQRIPCEVDAEGQTEEDLWSEHAKATERFLKLWKSVRSGQASVQDLDWADPSLLDLSVELSNRMLTHCDFCRWRCRIDRSAGTKHGTCQLESESRVSSYFHHRGEELVFRGTQGSGTIFFTSCNLRCGFCFPPQTLVMTDEGPVPLSELYAKAGFETEYGDGRVRFPHGVRAYTRDGRPTKVTKVFRHEHTGELIEIKPLYAPPIRATPGHKLLAAEDSDAAVAEVRADELSRGHYLAIPSIRFEERREKVLDVPTLLGPLAESLSFEIGKRPRPGAMRRVLALSEGGATSREIGEATGYHPTHVRLLLSRMRRDGPPKIQRQNGLVVEGNRVRLKTEKRPGLPIQLSIDEDLGEFLGYYCAEGHVTKGNNRPSSYTVILSFGHRERTLIRRSADLFEQLFGLVPTVTERRTATTVVVSKSSLGLMLKTLCGDNSRDKRVPAFLFRSSSAVIERFLEAYVAGDGCITQGYLSMNTVSRRLAMGLFALYVRLGHIPSFNTYQPPPWTVIEGRRVRQSTLYYVKVRLERMLKRDWATARRARYRIRDRYILVPIHRSSRVPYSGPVYNLEVEDPSHTYTADCLAVGNCQNGNISQDKENGIPVTPQQLASAAWQLRMEGCHNINWVGGDPTIHLHTIAQAIAILAKNQVNPEDLGYVSAVKAEFGRPSLSEEGGRYNGEINVPMLWNSNFFMSMETMRILRPLIDVWLPDFKFGNDKCSVFLARTPWYWETVSRNHQLVYDWGEDMVIRHLVMPNHVDCCTKPVLDWIAAHTPKALVNVMDQYHPDYACNPADPNYDPQYQELARRPYDREIREAYDHAAALGLRFEEVTFEKARGGALAAP